MGKVLPGWLLGMGTGAGGSRSLATHSPELQLRTQALPCWGCFALALELLSADAGLFSARHSSLLGNTFDSKPRLSSTSLVQNRSLVTTFQMMKVEAQNML